MMAEVYAPHCRPGARHQVPAFSDCALQWMVPVG